MADDPGDDGGDFLPGDVLPLPPPPGGVASSVQESTPVGPKPANFLLSYYDDLKLDMNELEPVKLGEGKFAVAYRAKLRGAIPVAVKRLKDTRSKEKLREELTKEVETWQQLSDDNVLRFRGYCMEPLALVSDFADGGDLHGVLEKVRLANAFPWAGRRECLLQVARGMLYLHSMDVLHCDLKPANILIRLGVYKIADFGLSSLRNLAGASTAGSPAYMPPESLRRPPAKRDKPADVYSFGVIAYEMSCGARPNVDVVRGLSSGVPFTRPYEIAGDDRMWRLMSSCAKIDPFERPSFEGVVDYISLGDGADLSASSSAASAAAVGVSSAPSYSYSAAALAPNEASASSAHSALAPENAGGADGVPVDRIVLQVANGGYGQGDNPKNLPMASESVDLLRTVLVSFYGFSGSPLYDRDSTAIRTAARPACASLRGAQGTSIIHLVGHGGDRRGRFVFEGVSPGATDEGQPAEDSTVDLERDIMSQIPEDHQGLVVVLLDCCRGSMGTEDRPFDVDRNNVVLGLAARRDAKAYGCLYTFVLAEELWKRFDNQSGNLTWRDVLYDVEQRIIAGTAVVASHPQGTNPPATALVQQPRHSTLGTGEVKWHKFPLRPRAKTTNAKEYIQRKVLGNEFRNRAKDLENMDALQQSYPLASYMEDLFSGNYMLEMTFGDGRAWESRRSAWTAADLVLELCKTSASYRDSSVINARLRCLSGAAIKYGLGRLWLKEPHELVYGFVREAVVTNYRILHEAQFDLDVARPEVERKPDMTELTFAVICGRHKLVRALLQGPWELHEADKEGNTPFHHACRSGDMSMVQLFLDRFGTFDHTVRNVDGKQASDLVPSPAEMGSIKAALQFAETERGMKIAPASAFVVASNNLKGTGAFGATQEGTFNGHPAAIRTSPSKFGDDLLFHNQITIRNVIGEHENVMPILGFCEDPPMIAYPIGSNDLHCYFWYQRNHPGYWKAACRLLRDVAAGVAHCHAHSVVHGDLKPSNVIVFEDAGDFPVARVADFSGSILRYGHARSGADFKGIGTIPFQPPEMLAAGGNINQRAKESDDVYAFAMVCFEAATRGYEPFYGQRQDEIMRRVVAGERPEIPPDTPPLLATLMKECWHQDPEQRPSFEVIVHRMKEIVSEVS